MATTKMTNTAVELRIALTVVVNMMFSGCCCPVQFTGREHVYLVGSESGMVHQCSKAYGSDYLASFGGHCMPVYAVKWNCMHPDMFLSCSADWSIKVCR